VRLAAFVAFVLFWVGVFTTVREWLHARKHGVPITRAEKFYLALAFPLMFGLQLVLILAGIARQVAAGTAVIAIGMALNAWAIKRRIQRQSLGL
jgi:hypothetical protein